MLASSLGLGVRVARNTALSVPPLSTEILIFVEIYAARNSLGGKQINIGVFSREWMQWLAYSSSFPKRLALTHLATEHVAQKLFNSF